jgi:hypothetical protein
MSARAFQGVAARDPSRSVSNRCRRVVRLRLQDALNNHHNSLVCTQSAPVSISFFHQHECHHFFFLAPAPSSVISAHPTTRALKSNGRYSERAKSSCSTKSNQPTSTRTRLACPRAPDQIHHPRLSFIHQTIVSFSPLASLMGAKTR